MNEEQKQILFKDLCGRLPYKVKVQVLNDSTYTNPLELMGIDYSKGLVKLGDNIGGMYFTHQEKIENVKLYLRPMSSMTQEEKKTYNSFIYHFEGNNLPDYEGDFVYANESHELVDWLNENHFDYQVLVFKGLALEAPEGMYKAMGE